MRKSSQRNYNIGGKMKKGNLKFLLLFICILLGLFFLYGAIFETNDLIKVWDHATYWLTTLGQKEALLTKTIGENLSDVYYSINHDDYNLLPSLLLQPFFMWSNGDFFHYGMAILTVGVIPAYILYVLLYRKIYKEKKSNWKYLLLFLIPFLTTPLIYGSVLDGYLDIIGVIPILIIFYYTYGYDFETFDLKRTIILALCFLFTIILRRYYVYFTVSYFISIAIVYIIRKLLVGNNCKLWKQAKNVFIIGISFSSVILLFFHEMIEHIIKGNYGTAYSAYLDGGLFIQMWDLITKLGIVVAILFVVATVYLWVRKKESREFIAILVLNMVITILLFNSIQTMDQHHYYTIIFNIVIMISMFMVELARNIRKSYNRRLYQVGLVFVCLIQFMTYSVALFRIPQTGVPVFTKTYFTYHDGYRKALKPVMDYTQEMIEKNPELSIYTIASSSVYNNETFANYNLPDVKLRSKFVATPNVDLRDGFSNQIYNATYVYLVTPIQHHLDLKDQQVVEVLWNAIEKDTPIRSNYELEKEFELPGAGLKIYKKIEDYTLEDKEYLKDQFHKSYPDNKELFEDRIMAG